MPIEIKRTVSVGGVMGMYKLEPKAERMHHMVFLRCCRLH